MLKTDNNANLWQRLITAAIGGPLLLGGVYLSEWVYFVLFFVVTLAGLLEFYQLGKEQGFQPPIVHGTIAGMTLFIISYFVARGSIGPQHYLWLFPVLTSSYFFKLYTPSDDKPFISIAYAFLGVMYVALPFSLLTLDAFHQGSYRWEIVIGACLLNWATDSGAYFAGRLFGKNKLFERISPNKTWEGAIGGALAVFVSAYFISDWYATALTPWKWYGMAAVFLVAGTYGDLIESLLKRSMSVKDSGKFLPGHGGLLDRVDGYLISAPFIAILILVL